jgi:1,4-alpha-glucan branching enzyme
MAHINTPHRDHRGSVPQTFTFVAPAARDVRLAGDFSRWERDAIPMWKEATGVWRIVIGLSPGAHEYRFLVDGEWRDDPMGPVSTPGAAGSAAGGRMAAR